MTDPIVPTHLIGAPGDSHSLCGVKDPLPVLFVRYLDQHIQGHASRGRTFYWCEACGEVIDHAPPPLPGQTVLFQ